MPVNIIDTLKPKNGGNFPIVEAIDVFVEGFDNLADAVSHFATDVMIEAINTVLSGKANTSDVNAAVANLQGQINQIIISASSEAVVAPEVAAARVGEDGAEHTTLKQRLDSDYSFLKSNISGISDWLGFSQNLCNCNDFTISNTSNWALSTTRDSITVTHKTEFGTGYPNLELDLPAGSYVFHADFSESSEKRFGLYLNGTYEGFLLDGGTITLSETKTVKLAFGPSSTGTFIITGISLKDTNATGKINELEGSISEITGSVEELTADVESEEGKIDKAQYDATDLSSFIGYALNAINATEFQISNTTNWGLTTTIDSITVVHKNTLTTGYPILNLNIPAGTYKFTADFSGSSLKFFGLYKNGSYDSMVNNNDNIVIESGNTYSLQYMPSDAGTYIVTNINLVNTAPSGIYQEIESEIGEINATLSNLPFVKVYKPADITTTINSFILPNGTISDSASQNYVVSQYIELHTAKVKVTASANYGNNYYAFYDTNQNFISGELSEAGATITAITEKEIDVPSTAKYIVVAAILTKNQPICEIYTDELVTDSSLNQSKLEDKTWCVIGDSLTDKNNNQAPIRYFNYLSVESTSIVNLGKSGTGYLQTYNQSENYVDRVDALTGEEGYDVISVFGGINDSGHIGTDYQLGQLGDTEPTTIYGAIYYVFNSLITKFPLAFVFAITSPVTDYRYNLGNNIDVIQQAVREVCAWLKIPVADVNKNAPMRPFIPEFSAEYYHDGTHPNSKGHEIIAKAMTSVFDVM